MRLLCGLWSAFLHTKRVLLSPLFMANLLSSLMPGLPVRLTSTVKSPCSLSQQCQQAFSLRMTTLGCCRRNMCAIPKADLALIIVLLQWYSCFNDCRAKSSCPGADLYCNIIWSLNLWFMVCQPILVRHSMCRLIVELGQWNFEISLVGSC